MAFNLKNLATLLTVAIQHNASDIHIRTNEVPCLRIKGELLPIKTKIFSEQEISDILKILETDRNKSFGQNDQKIEVDGAFTINDLCRIRYNVFKYFGHTGIVMRVINTQVPSLASLEMPKIFSQIALQKRGLIIVTGATGSGKTTTLAAMMNHVNENRGSHIITIEDPIEYLHTQKMSRISQREVGTDTLNFESGIHSALRQDPDVIMVGEMRDIETVGIALKASETGHAVFSTLHTTNIITTINRMISLFPQNDQTEARKRLAENLYAIVCQRNLLGRKGEIIIAQEIMITSAGIKDCIVGKDDLNRITSIVSQGLGKSINGSQTFDQHIMYLYQTGKITKEVALEAVSSQSDFIQKLIVT